MSGGTPYVTQHRRARGPGTGIRFLAELGHAVRAIFRPDGTTGRNTATARPAAVARTRRFASICLVLVLGLGLTTACAVPALTRGAKGATLVGESVGYASRTSFFRNALARGERALTRDTLAKGGEYSGGKSGLYGGSLNTSSCDVGRLLTFLKNPVNRAKVAAWSQVLGLAPDGIEQFLRHEVTPVLLGNDTLVRNHGYEKGKATAYDSVLEAGMAVLVDLHGVPAVKCNCGNPLTSSKASLDMKIKIHFKGKRWNFKKKRMVKVKASKTPRKAIVLATDNPAENIVRSVGANGAQEDEPVQATDAVTMPDLVGQPEDAARAQLENLGLEAVSERDLDSDQEQEQGTVTSTEPSANSTVGPGTTVVLTVAGPATPSTSVSEGSGGITETTTPVASPPTTGEGDGDDLTTAPPSGDTGGADLIGGADGTG
ncbi:PASTA domain-containing protein [Streptomyces sp. NBC_00659]|uniref:PASTA domain-containing protein n=1 Tax=Streptomyces sp. NBC_00659 TaxID=2903669 RepID=UPI002E312333|nr:PASTA domain-containing protein [Streptomyces sp. NBC_00659]